MKADVRNVVLVMVVAVVARLAVALPGFGTLNDPDNYLPLARSLAEHRGFALDDGRPTAYRPPLYPIVLAPLVAIGDRWLPTLVLALHLGLGLGTVGLTYQAARRWGYHRARSTVAALIVAVDPVAVLQSRSVMTETLAAFLVAAGLAALTVPGLLGPALGGLVAGLETLCRPSLLPGAGLTVLALVTAGPDRSRRRWLASATFVGVMAMTVAPWAIRNARRFGEPVWTTTHGGFTLALANNLAYYQDVVDGPPGAVWSGPNQRAWEVRIDRETAGMSQPEADRYLRGLALALARDRPGTFVRASWARLGRLWGLAPSAMVYPAWVRIATAAWTLPLWVALVLGLANRETWRWPRVAAPATVLGLTCVHFAYWTDLRMRVPMVAAIALVAARAGRGWPPRRRRRKIGDRSESGCSNSTQSLG